MNPLNLLKKTTDCIVFNNINNFEQDYKTYTFSVLLLKNRLCNQ